MPKHGQRKEVPQYWEAIVEILSQVVSMPQLLPSTFPLPFCMEIRSHYSSAQIRLMASILFPIKNLCSVTQSCPPLL